MISFSSLAISSKPQLHRANGVAQKYRYISEMISSMVEAVKQDCKNRINYVQHR
jgi:hypothetical protein